LSIQAYLKKAGEGLQKKINDNLEYAKNNPYPADDLKSFGETSALAKIYGPAGEKARVSSFSPDIIAMAMDEARGSSPDLWKRLEKGQKGLNKIKSNDEVLSKLDLEKELRKSYSEVLSKMAGTGLTIDELLKSDSGEFNDVILDLDLDTYGASDLLQVAFQEIRDQGKNEPQQSQINQENENLEKPNQTISTINESTSEKRESSIIASTQINDQEKSPIEQSTVKSTNENVLSSKGELIKSEETQTETPSQEISINLEEKAPLKITNESVTKEVQATSSPVNVTVESIPQKEVPPISTVSSNTTINSSETNVTESPNITNTSSTNSLVSPLSSTAINNSSNLTQSSEPISQSTARESTFSTSLIEKLMGGTINSINNESLVNNENSTQSVIERFKSSLNQIESFDNTNQLTSLTSEGPEKISSNFMESINNSEKILQNRENENTNSETSLISSVNNIEKIKESLNSSENSSSLEKNSSTNSILKSIDRNNVTVDRKNMEVVKQAPLKSDIQNNSTQITNGGSTDSTSLNQNTSNGVTATEVNSNSQSNSNTSQITNNSSESAMAPTNTSVNVDISQLASAISRLERILISGIDVTIKDNA
jgi:hypothetical protein